MINSSLWQMFANIKNAQISKKSTILQKKSKICFSFLNVLWDEGFISGFRSFPFSSDYFEIFLKYNTNGYSAINYILNLSKPGKRYYYTSKQLWKIKTTTNVIILSTSKGILTSNRCKKYNIGGQPLLLVN